MSWCFESWRNSTRTVCRFEFWVSYTRFLLSIEVSWDNKIRFESLLKLYAVAFIKFEESLWSWFSHQYLEILSLKKHCSRDLRINISKFFLLDLYQSALKIWKSSSWVTQKKHDLMTSLSAAFSIESLISYNSQFSIWWLTADWLTESFEFEFFLIFYSFTFYIESMSCSREVIKRERRRIDAIAFDIRFRKSSRFSISISFRILNVQLDRAAVFEDVSDTIQLFMRRKL